MSGRGETYSSEPAKMSVRDIIGGDHHEDSVHRGFGDVVIVSQVGTDSANGGEPDVVGEGVSSPVRGWKVV